MSNAMMDLIGIESEIELQGAKLKDKNLDEVEYALEYLIKYEDEFYESMREYGFENIMGKGMFSRMLSSLKAMISSPEEWIAMTARDISMINTAEINPGLTTTKFDHQAVVLWLKRFNYLCIDPAKMQELSSHRRELMRRIGDIKSAPGEYFKAVGLGYLIVILEFVLGMPFGVIIVTAFICDVYIWFKLICWIVAALDWVKIGQGEFADKWIDAMCEIAADMYMNGSGKKISKDKDGKVSIEDLNKIIREYRSINDETESAFLRCETGVDLDYNSKLQIANLLRENARNLSLDKTKSTAKNVQAYLRSISRRLDKKVYNFSGSPYAPKCNALSELWDVVWIMSKRSRQELKLIVKGLYRF